MKKIIVTILTAIITIIIARFSGMNAFAHGYASEWFKSDYDIYIGEVTAVDDIEVTSRNRNVEVLPTAFIYSVRTYNLLSDYCCYHIYCCKKTQKKIRTEMKISVR